MTQPAITHHMRVLEEMCGLKLVERVGNRVLPTAAGASLYSTSRQLLGVERDVQETIRTLREGQRGSVAIGTNSSGGMNVILRILQTLRVEYPEIDVKLSVAETGAILDALSERSIDLAVVRGPVPAKLFDAEALCPDLLVPIVAADHPLAHRAPLKIQELADVPLILPFAGSSTRAYVLERLREAGVHGRVAMEFNVTEHIKNAVEGCLGLAVVSRWVVERELHLGVLVALDVEGFPLQREYQLVQRKGSAVSPAAAQFLDVAHAVAPDLHFDDLTEQD